MEATKFDPVAAFNDLDSHLGAFKKLRDLTGDGTVPKTSQDFVMEYGGRMPHPRHPLADSLILPKSKECYLNAWRLKKRVKGLRYCEGYVFLDNCPMPVMHGWCLNSKGKVVDPSVENERDAVYYGVVFEEGFAKSCWQVLLKKHSIGILGNWYMLCRDFPNELLEQSVSKP